ncbi:MAG: DNA-directed RNA polymerase subunit alpha [bacterium]|nr:DNA-directed RNA polymerase subunit alpha [bacterium]
MQKIALPGQVEFIETADPNRQKIIIEPCYPGYGATLGSALRRVLLSSLPGAAAIGVKIKGADHEFMALPHIKEDVLELILNVKKLRLKIFTDEVVKLELDARGEKPVTAADIKKNSSVEIANPELLIGNITDISGKLEMEIFVAKGLGYVTVESRESDKHEIGYIEMDSIFTPILLVGINVENVRVGKMTNWDKLVIDLATDGTITPVEAFNKAVEILIAQFSALTGKTEEAVEEIKIEDMADEKETAKEKAEETAGDEKPKKRGRPKKHE